MQGADICDVHLFIVKKRHLIMSCKMPPFFPGDWAENDPLRNI